MYETLELLRGLPDWLPLAALGAGMILIPVLIEIEERFARRLG